jgi:hypothetical protein
MDAFWLALGIVYLAGSAATAMHLGFEGYEAREVELGALFWPYALYRELYIEKGFRKRK